MRKRMILLASLLVGLALLLGGMRALASPPAEAPALSLQVNATSNMGTVTYSTTLVNTTSKAVGDIYVAVELPEETRFMQVSATPKGCNAFGLSGNVVAWSCGSVATGDKLGPLSFDVRVSGKEAGPTNAWARWTSPSAGSASSPEFSFTSVVVNTPRRGCESCHVPNAPHNLAEEAEERAGPAHPHLPADTSVETCLSCHKPGTGARKDMGAVAPKMLRDIVHPAHLNSTTFTSTYGGNCFTCHNVDGSGTFVLLGKKVETDFRGIPKNVPILGIPSSEGAR